MAFSALYSLVDGTVEGSGGVEFAGHGFWNLAWRLAVGSVLLVAGRWMIKMR